MCSALYDTVCSSLSWFMHFIWEESQELLLFKDCFAKCRIGADMHHQYIGTCDCIVSSMYIYLSIYLQSLVCQTCSCLCLHYSLVMTSFKPCNTEIITLFLAFHALWTLNNAHNDVLSCKVKRYCRNKDAKIGPHTDNITFCNVISYADFDQISVTKGFILYLCKETGYGQLWVWQPQPEALLTGA